MSETPAETPGTPAEPPATPPVPNPPAEAPKPAETPKAPEPKTVEDLPGWAQKLLADARKDAGEERVASKTLSAIQKALNPDAKADEKPDAEALTKALSSKDETIRELSVKLAIKDALEANGANKLTEAVLIGEGKLKDLDPTADDFQTKLSAAVKDAVKRHPELRAVQAAGASGANFGGPGETTTPASRALPGQPRLAAAYANNS